MFHSARIKLTAWYLLIIMLISISFSVGMYKIFDSELDRVQSVQRFRTQHRLPGQFRTIPDSDNQLRSFFLDPDIINETKNRFIIILTIINLAILGASGVAGYFLAGRTLNPIKEMIDEQNIFITNVSHEIRTPLTALRAEIEVNLRNNKLTLVEAKKLLESNLEEVNNLQILSDRLIKLIQYQKHDNYLITNNVSLNSIIKEAIKKTASLAKSKNITIVNKMKNYTIQGLEQSLIELFVIFMDNAIKYSKEGSKVLLESEKTDGHIIVSVIDYGIGIKEDNIQHLFDRFYRADKSRTKQNAQGYGLGLSIAKEIVNKHKGSISVKSKAGKGTTFSIKLPLKSNFN